MKKAFELKKELETAKKLSIYAGNEILKFYKKNFTIELKTDLSPLTEADKASNNIIVQSLKKEFPDYSILSEEEHDNKERLNNDWCWIIDPLDGTKEFLKQNDEFTVNIALSYKHKSILGVIYIPVTGELFYALKGQGAFYFNNNKTIRIKVSDKTSNLILIKSRTHHSSKLDKLINLNKLKIGLMISAGSSIKGCLIAKGEADIYYRFNPTMEWDTAAMQCIVEESGGIFLQLDDTEMSYNRVNTLNEKGFYILNKIENKLKI